MALKIEPLSREHDRDGFDCGSEPFNAYLKHVARQHADRGISRTFVLVDEATAKPRPILGFFTLSLCRIAGEDLPPDRARKLPREVADLKLGRLGIARAHQRRGLGRALVVEAMRKCLAVCVQAGGIGLFVDAKDDAARQYYEQFGFVSLTPDPLQMFLRMQTLEKALAQ